MATKHTLTQSDLSQFSGTEHWYKHNLVPAVTYTEGVRYVADHGGAYWLVDEIAFAQLTAKIRREPFQHWTLKKDASGTGATLKATDGGKNGNAARTIFSKHIEYTDFPLDKIALYYSDGVILLPGEY